MGTIRCGVSAAGRRSEGGLDAEEDGDCVIVIVSDGSITIVSAVGWSRGDVDDADGVGGNTVVSVRKARTGTVGEDWSW